MGSFINIAGKRFGKLTVQSIAPRQNKRTMWSALCDCGNRTVIRGESMKRGTTVSCGCVAVERLAEHRTTHGKVGTRTYGIWKGMKARCLNPRFPGYGAAGITVCERWHDFTSFLADMGEAPAGLSIDRIDGTKGYQPGNCRWADASTQARNRRSNVNLTWRGETMCLTDWARRLAVNEDTLYARVVRQRWPIERAFMRPVTKFGDRQARGAF